MLPGSMIWPVTRCRWLANSILLSRLTCSRAVSYTHLLALARACWDTLREYGTAALAEAQEKRPGPALERIVEANICLSGIGFESGGLAAAHAVNNGLAALPAGRASSHGEKVAFGTLVQLVLEQRPVSYTHLDVYKRQGWWR